MINEKNDTVLPLKKPLYEIIKRIFDIVLSLIALLVFSPVIIAVIIAILIEDGKSPFYTSVRMTKDAREFKMYKFRSMYKNADKDLEKLKKHNTIVDGPAFKMDNDPRITNVGKFIRKTSIDEIPQFLNVIKGDMTIVGPRPPLPNEVARYTPYQRQRLGVKQGITCYWQCGGRNDIGFREWVELDLKYIRERSLLVDAKILFRTVKAVFMMKGAK